MKNKEKIKIKKLNKFNKNNLKKTEMSYSKNTIFSTVIQCNYDKNFHHHITTNINTLNEKNFQNFFIQIIDHEGSKLIQIFLEIFVLYNNTQKFSIPISILVTKKFPYEPPIFKVILKSNNTIYNQQNHDIELSTGKLMVKSLINWDYSLTLFEILKEVSISFNNVFPILQAPPGHISNNTMQNQAQQNNYNQNINRNSNANWINQNPQQQNQQNINQGNFNRESSAGQCNFLIKIKIIISLVKNLKIF